MQQCTVSGDNFDYIEDATAHYPLHLLNSDVSLNTLTPSSTLMELDFIDPDHDPVVVACRQVLASCALKP